MALLRPDGVAVLRSRRRSGRSTPRSCRAAGDVSAAGADDDLDEVDLCLVLGGDGTMLRGVPPHPRSRHPGGRRQSRARGLPHHRPQRQAARRAWSRLLAGRVHRAPAAGAEGRGWARRCSGPPTTWSWARATARTPAPWRSRINGVTLFEVLCDGVVVGTPAGSSAYSLAAGGPLLGISVDAYVISLVAPHAVGVRPVVAAPGDVLEIINTDDARDCFVDIDGQRSAPLPPGAVMRDQDGAGHDHRSPCWRATACTTTSATGFSRRSASMLASLTIRNFVLIEDAVLEFEPGLTVLTGETGAGKTLLTKALGLLMGERAEDGLVGAARRRGPHPGRLRSGRRTQLAADPGGAAGAGRAGAARARSSSPGGWARRAAIAATSTTPPSRWRAMARRRRRPAVVRRPARVPQAARPALPAGGARPVGGAGRAGAGRGVPRGLRRRPGRRAAVWRRACAARATRAARDRSAALPGGRAERGRGCRWRKRRPAGRAARAVPGRGRLQRNLGWPPSCCTSDGRRRPTPPALLGAGGGAWSAAWPAVDPELEAFARRSSETPVRRSPSCPGSCAHYVDRVTVDPARLQVVDERLRALHRPGPQVRRLHRGGVAYLARGRGAAGSARSRARRTCARLRGGAATRSAARRSSWRRALSRGAPRGRAAAGAGGGRPAGRPGDAVGRS